jgi:hypothetical protein
LTVRDTYVRDFLERDFEFLHRLALYAANERSFAFGAALAIIVALLAGFLGALETGTGELDIDAARASMFLEAAEQLHVPEVVEERLRDEAEQLRLPAVVDERLLAEAEQLEIPTMWRSSLRTMRGNPRFSR